MHNVTVIFWIAQAGSALAGDVIEQAIDMARRTRESWQETWDFTLEVSAISLWGAVVKFALTIAVFALIYMAIQYGKEIFETKSLGKVMEMFIFPFTVVFLLGGNGFILAAIVQLLRGVGQEIILSVLSISLGGVTLETAINQLNFNILAIARIRQLFSECDGEVGAALNTCFEEKVAEAQAIVDNLNGDLSAVQSFLDTITSFLPAATGGIIQDVSNFYEGGFAQVIQGRVVPILQIILYAIQWAIANIMEAALLLTALFAPIAVALSLMPMAGRPVFAWLSGFIGILAIQLGYNILVGLIAFVLVNIDGPAEAVSGIGFLFFVAIFAPFLSYQVGRGGGVALYHAISRNAARMIDAFSSIISLAITKFV